jgi:hypothetical protein
MQKPIFEMTVGDLKEALARFDDDMPVAITYDYGDHCHRQVALSPRLDEEVLSAVWSEYCQNNIIPEQDRIGDHEDAYHSYDEATEVLVLNGNPHW